MPEIVGGCPLEPVLVLEATTTVDAARRAVDALGHGGDTWVGIGDQQGRLRILDVDDLAGAWEGATLADLEPHCVAPVTVPWHAEVADVIRSPELLEGGPGAAVVVVRPGGIQGVWAGTDLADAVLSSSALRSFADTTLHGTTLIKEIARACAYTERATVCTTTCTFEERPDAMPSCPNAQGLSPHAFVW